jgi:plasmid stabilization system protein ParE
MEYVVNLTARAMRDLEHLYEEMTARKWYQGLKKEILSLERLPYRCSVAPENKEMRHLVYGHGHGAYRVIFRIVGKQVDVLHIRHGARKRLR